MTPNQCPDCKQEMTLIPGCGFDYDVYVCSCGHETEMDVRTDQRVKGSVVGPRMEKVIRKIGEYHE